MNREKIIEKLSKEEKEFVDAWQYILDFLKRKKDIAYIWEIKKKFKIIWTKAKRVEHIEKNLDKLKLRLSIEHNKYKKEVEHVDALLEHVKKEFGPNKDFIRLVDYDIRQIIKDIEEEKHDLAAEGRRSFIKKVAVGAAASAIAAKVPSKLYSQDNKYDISYGTFYNFDMACNRYWDIRDIFKEGNLRLIQISDLLGIRYRIITYFDREKKIALKKVKEKYAEIVNYFNKPEFSHEDRKERIGEVGVFSRDKYKEFKFIDITPKVRPKKEIKKRTYDGFYVQFSANTKEKYAIENEASLISQGFAQAFIFLEKINGETYYKTLIGPFKDEASASIIGNKILEVPSLVDLLGYPEIVVIEIIKNKTQWKNAIILRKFKVETSKEKLKEKGSKKVVTTIGKKQIDELIDLVVDEWNINEPARVVKWNETYKEYKNFEEIRKVFVKLDKNLIKAVVFVESSYKPDKAGYDLKHIGNNKFKPVLDKDGNPIITAYGLMQVRLDAAKEVRFDWKKVQRDPLTNIRAGIAYFGKYCQIFKGDLNRALGAYNAGPGRAFKNTHLNYAETREYIRKVNEQWRVYTGLSK